MIKTQTVGDEHRSYVIESATHWVACRWPMNVPVKSSLYLPVPDPVKVNHNIPVREPANLSLNLPVNDQAKGNLPRISVEATICAIYVPSTILPFCGVFAIPRA